MSKMFVVVYWSSMSVNGYMLRNAGFTTIPFQTLAAFKTENEAKAFIERIAMEVERVQERFQEETDLCLFEGLDEYDVCTENITIKHTPKGGTPTTLVIESDLGSLSPDFCTFLDGNHVVGRKALPQDSRYSPMAEAWVEHESCDGGDEDDPFDCAWGILEVPTQA